MIWSYGGDGQIIEPYFIDEPLQEDGVNDYIGGTGSELAPSGWAKGVQSFENPEPSVGYQWTTAQILTAMADAGLRIETVREYPYANGCSVFEGMKRLPQRRFGMPEGVASMPLMLGVVAGRPG